jgi:hypothetical protein
MRPVRFRRRGLATMKSPVNEQPQQEPTSIRFGQRIRLELPVQLSVEGKSLGGGVIRNASISGAFIETALTLPPLTVLTVTVGLRDDSKPTSRELSACFVRADPAGLGIEWLDTGGVDILDLLTRASAGR